MAQQHLHRIGAGEKLPPERNNAGKYVLYDPTALFAFTDGGFKEFPVQERVKVEYDQFGTVGSLTVLRLRYGNRTVLTTEPGTESPDLVKASNADVYIFRGVPPFPFALYQIDPQTLRVTPLTPAKINGYDLFGTLARLGTRQPDEEEHDPRPVLIWAHDPSINPSGTLVAYVSNRRQFANAESWDEINPAQSDIWVVDTRTGVHKPIIPWRGFAGIVGWQDDRTLILSDSETESLLVVDVPTGEARKVVHRGVMDVLDYRHGQVVYAVSSDRDRVIAASLLTGTGQTYNMPDHMYFSFGGMLSPGARKLVFYLHARNEAEYRPVIGILDLDGSTWSLFRPPPHIEVLGAATWVSEHLLMVPARDRTTLQESSWLLRIESSPESVDRTGSGGAG